MGGKRILNAFSTSFATAFLVSFLSIRVCVFLGGLAIISSGLFPQISNSRSCPPTFEQSLIHASNKYLHFGFNILCYNSMKLLLLHLQLLLVFKHVARSATTTRVALAIDMHVKQVEYVLFRIFILFFKQTNLTYIEQLMFGMKIFKNINQNL